MSSIILQGTNAPWPAAHLCHVDTFLTPLRPWLPARSCHDSHSHPTPRHGRLLCCVHLMDLGRNCTKFFRKRKGKKPHQKKHYFFYCYYYYYYLLQDKAEESSTIALYYLNVLNGEYLNWLRFEGDKSGNNILKVLHQKVFPSRKIFVQRQPRQAVLT